MSTRCVPLSSPWAFFLFAYHGLLLATVSSAACSLGRFPHSPESSGPQIPSPNVDEISHWMSSLLIVCLLAVSLRRHNDQMLERITGKLLHSCTGVLVSFCVADWTHQPKSNVKQERICLASAFTPQNIMDGSQSRSLRQKPSSKNWGREHREMLLTGNLNTSTFLIQPRPASMGAWPFLSQLAMKNIPCIYGTGQSKGGNSPTEVPSFQFCQDGGWS